MSRPTSSSSSARTIDPRQNTKLNIKLGPTLLGDASGFSSIAFNHKPSQTGRERKTVIAKTADGYNLSIRDVEDEQVNDFQYTGNKWSKAGSYVVTFDTDGQALVLDKLDSEYAFNLIAAPWEKDANKLAQQYKEVTQDRFQSDDEDLNISGEEDGLFDEDGEPDPANPFDYRHYLKSLTKSVQEPRSSANKSTPLLVPSRAAPPVRPSAAKPSAVKRPAVRTQQQPRPRQAQALRAPPPRVRLERRASDKRSSPAISEDINMDEEDDGLVIDMGDGYQSRKKHKSMLLTPQAPGRPISLRSAAASASPSASLASPAPPEPGSGYEEDNEEAEDEEADEEDDDEVFRDHTALEADEDVEDLALGSPAVVSGAPGLARRQSTWDDSTEADLQAELERALGADDDEEVSQPVAQESEEESEEE